MSKKLRKRLRGILVGAGGFIFLLVLSIIFEDFEASPAALILYFLLFIYIGRDVLKKAFGMIIRGRAMDENFLMSIASIGAFIIGSYSEGAAVMLFYQIGEWFQALAVDKSRRSIKELMDIRPDYATLLENGVAIAKSPEEVHQGELILIKPGERIPLDCIVEEGSSAIDTKALTGEALPVDVEAGSSLISGCVNCHGLLKARVTKEYTESTVSRILNLINEGENNKSTRESFITQFARVYTPIVVILALLVAIVPPVITANMDQWSVWLYRGLSFLVISCPCALVISIPLGFFGGIGGAGRRGILIKGSRFIEELATINAAAFDKTGTLTNGSFSVEKIISLGAMTEDKLLQIAALAESHSNHPIALSITGFYGRENEESSIYELKEYPGKGVRANIDSKIYYVGNERLMAEAGLSLPEVDEPGSRIYLSTEEEIIGVILIRDTIKKNADRDLDTLRSLGVKTLVMLTGDSKDTAEFIGAGLGITEIYSSLLPQHKVELIETIKNRTGTGAVMFVGDGINDAPVLTKADIGVAMGAMGADAAIEAADVVIMSDNLSRLGEAITLSRRTMRIVKENIVFSIGVKVAVLVLAFFGIASMWAAVFADVGVAFIAILNSMRTLRIPKEVG